MWCAQPSSSRRSQIVRSSFHSSPLLLIGLVLALPAGGYLGCGKGPGGGAKRIPRDKDAAPVVLVESAGDRALSFSDEVEPNDDSARATALAVDTGVRGTLDGETDVDVYAVAVPEAGILDARLSGIEGVDLILELRDDQGTVLARSDRGPALTVEGIPNAVATPGTYLLAVSEFVKKKKRKRRRKPKKGSKADSEEPTGRTGPSPRYELTVRLIAEVPESYEVEPNEADDVAAELIVGEPARGYLGWSKDVDVWKVSIEGFAAEYSLDLDVDAVPGITPTLTIRDHRGAAVLTRKGKKDHGLAVRNLVVFQPPEDMEHGDGDGDKKTDSAGRKPDSQSKSPPSTGDSTDSDAAQLFYYVELRARRSNPLEPYRIAAANRLLDVDDEVEPNDDQAHAVPLRDPPLDGATGRDDSSEGIRRGHLTIGDIDSYRISAGSEPMLLSVTVRPIGEADIELTALVDGQPVATSNQDKAGGAETLADVRVEAGKTAQVKVAGSGKAGSDGAYELRWAADPAGSATPGPEPGSEPNDGDGAAGELGTLDEYEDE